MPSPFPGMNPYLERAEDWNDFHDTFIPMLRMAIVKVLPEPYRTRIDENVYIHELSAEERKLIGRPDLLVTASDPSQTVLPRSSTSAPAIACVPEGIDILELNYLEILDKRDQSVVTVIELISPSNKTSSGDGEVYRNKVLRYLRSKTNFVELDFLRAGSRSHWSKLTESDYSVVVSRASERPQVAHWPISLRERLPVIPIPLHDGNADLNIDLQEVLHAVYDGSGYAKYIYELPPDPPLSKEDADWAASILTQANP